MTLLSQKDFKVTPKVNIRKRSYGKLPEKTPKEQSSTMLVPPSSISDDEIKYPPPAAVA